jgi:ABC-type transport system involved in cytochrome c biogenesis permease component
MTGAGAARGEHMIWAILLSIALVVPFWRLLPEYGISSWWALAAVLPLGALILLYIMAFGAGRKGGRG